MRREAKHRAIGSDLVSDDVFYPHEAARHLLSPSIAVEHEEFCIYLHRAVLQLTPSQRTVFLLRYKEELTLKDIACRLGRSIGTVKAHLFHAHRTLRHQLLPYFKFRL